MRQLGWIVGGVIAVAAIVFAIRNNAEQSVDLWPLPFIVELPLYALVLLAIAVGFVFGTALTWISEGKWRRLARRRKRQIAALDREIAALKPDTPEAGTGLPATRHAPAPAPTTATTFPPGEPLPPGAGS